MGGLQSLFGRRGKDKNLFPLPGIEPQFPGNLVRRQSLSRPSMMITTAATCRYILTATSGSCVTLTRAICPVSAVKVHAMRFELSRQGLYSSTKLSVAQLLKDSSTRIKLTSIIIRKSVRSVQIFYFYKTTYVSYGSM
jgi:hypothetical protein